MDKASIAERATTTHEACWAAIEKMVDIYWETIAQYYQVGWSCFYC